MSRPAAPAVPTAPKGGETEGAAPVVAPAVETTAAPAATVTARASSAQPSGETSALGRPSGLPAASPYLREVANALRPYLHAPDLLAQVVAACNASIEHIDVEAAAWEQDVSAAVSAVENLDERLRQKRSAMRTRYLSLAIGRVAAQCSLDDGTAALTRAVELVPAPGPRGRRETATA